MEGRGGGAWMEEGVCLCMWGGRSGEGGAIECLMTYQQAAGMGGAHEKSSCNRCGDARYALHLVCQPLVLSNIGHRSVCLTSSSSEEAAGLERSGAKESC